jgi:hypothetical protein
MRKGSIPLLVIHRTPPSFLDAALEARRALASATTDASVTDAASRMMVQLHGLAECIGEMAATGLLNVDVTALNLQTHSRQTDGQWASQTRVVRLPPPFCQEIKLPPEVCNSIMQALVVFSAIENDPDGELVEIREMAAMVHADWPDLSTSSIGRAFEASMGRARAQLAVGKHESVGARALGAAARRGARVWRRRHDLYCYGARVCAPHACDPSRDPELVT